VSKFRRPYDSPACKLVELPARLIRKHRVLAPPCPANLDLRARELGFDIFVDPGLECCDQPSVIRAPLERVSPICQ
jgi:hypothetical protein